MANYSYYKKILTQLIKTLDNSQLVDEAKDTGQILHLYLLMVFLAQGLKQKEITGL